MNQMEIFKNPEFGSVRVIEENGKYLFCGLDVTAALGYKDSAKALKAHCTSDGWAFYPLIDNVGRTQQTRFISEGNLYRLIVHSKLPSAERFERWVFDEVLPSIRKHGAYITREKLWEVATSPEAMMKLCSDLLAEREENAVLRKENAMDTSIFLGGKEPTTLKELAAVLGKETIDTYNTGESRGRETSHSLNYQKLGKELMSQDELAVMDGGKCILQLRGVRPFLSDKYDITKHPNFKYTADASDKNAFDIEAFLSTRLKLKPNEVCDVYEVDTEGA